MRLQMNLKIARHNIVRFDVRDVAEKWQLQVGLDVVLGFNRVIQIIDKKGQTDSADETAEDAHQKRENLARLGWTLGNNRGIDNTHIIHREVAGDLVFADTFNHRVPQLLVEVRF